ncbi:heme-binding protein [Mesorhizobium sp. WSM2239]|uniref:Heme-binding protein n=2 Tax=unclassified Mesorhizobium TaxID=325217 RepID=A0AAU8DHZ0_9HYPH
MTDLPLSAAQTILNAALTEARRLDLKPVAVVVLDGRGAVKATAAEDGTSLKRFEVAHGKAYGALALGMGSRAIGNRAVEQPTFVAAVSHVVGGALVPAPGGVLAKAKDGRTVAAIGISGDTSDNDETCAKVGIETAGLTAETG